MIWNIKKQKTTNQQQEEKRIQKKRGKYKQPLEQLQAVQHLHHRGARRRREEQENGNLSEKIVKENFPNLVKEIDMQVQEAQRVPVMMDAKRPTPRHIIIKRPKVKDQESLKSSKRKAVSFLQGNSLKTVS